MKRMVQEYVEAKTNLVKQFACNDDYFIKILDNCSWTVREDEGVSFLTYRNLGGAQTDALIVRKDSKPLIYATADYTMVIAIDCIKIAFILKNTNKEF